MPNLTASIPHQLSRDQAKRRIQEGLAEARRQYGGILGGLHETWSGDTMDFAGFVMGQHIAGRIDVRDRDVYVEVALPGLLGMAADMLRPLIERRGRQMLTGPEQSGERSA